MRENFIVQQEQESTVNLPVHHAVQGMYRRNFLKVYLENACSSEKINRTRVQKRVFCNASNVRLASQANLLVSHHNSVGYECGRDLSPSKPPPIQSLDGFLCRVDGTELEVYLALLSWST